MEIIEKFVGNLKNNPSVKSVILFGSYARGNQSPDSDIDLIVVCDETKRGVEKFESYTFEIVYVKEEDAIDFYKKNKDNAVRTWAVAKVLYDKDGSAERLRHFVEKIKKEGKVAFSENVLEHLRFDAEDTFRAIQKASETDKTSAMYLLEGRVVNLANVFFDARGLWKPAPKQLLRVLRESNSELGKLYDDFYVADTFDQKIAIAKKMVSITLMV